MADALTEMAVLEQIRATLEAEGYIVTVQPRGLDVPGFLSGINPDAIAKSGNRNLLIEVMSRSSDSQAKVNKFRNAVAGQPGWTFLPVWTSGQTVPAKLEPPSAADIRKIFGQIDALRSSGFLVPAFLAQWSLFEAIGRRHMPDQLSRYQTPKTLIEKIASMGMLNNQQASKLRKLIRLRNQAVHGRLDLEIPEQDILEFDKILRHLDVNKVT
jgi:hypothetical protein